MHLRSAKGVLQAIRFNFASFLPRRLSDISAYEIDRWRTLRLSAGKRPGTVNRAAGRLRSALSKAVEWELLKTHPLAKIKPLAEDDERIVRYLSPEEEQRLRAVLDERDATMREERANANVWRSERDYERYPDIPDDGFGGVLTPIVLCALNTGMRRGELLDMQWSAVDFERGQIAVSAATAKDREPRRVPMNSELIDVLQRWKRQSNGSAYVFPGRAGDRRENFKRSWRTVLKRAHITDFRFHDCRHHFASRLVMSGVDLYTVAKLLGHSNARMTERYAHLAPGHLQEAVERLVR
jgi:integrase